MDEVITWDGEEETGQCSEKRNSISDLPNELIIAIISLLPIKEAVRTSVLGRSWRYMWSYISNLDFDGWKIIRSRLVAQINEECQSEKMRFVNLVNQVLNLHHAKTIERFRVRHMVDTYFGDDVDTWIKFAFEKRVKILELDLAPTMLESPFMFGLYHFSKQCLDSLPHEFSSFNHLEKLYLKNVDVTSEVLEHCVANCPHLEVLCVKSTNCLSGLRICGPSLPLKHLEISYCSKFTHLEICAPNLVSFVHRGSRISVDLKNAPQIINLSLGCPTMSQFISSLFEFNSYFTQLETLRLKYNSRRGSMESSRFPNLPRLKKLVVDVYTEADENLFILSSFINAVPLLQEFTLVLVCVWRRRERMLRHASGRTHQCLKRIEIEGFVGLAIDVEFIMFLVENATSIERIIIDPEDPSMPEEFRDVNAICFARQRAEQLKTELPPGIDVVIR